jgi:hypothetical protein
LLEKRTFDALTSCWVHPCLVLFRPFQVGGTSLVCMADGIKAPKEGKRMPGVKLLHQESHDNTKPEYIMGHSFQALSLLVHSAGGQVAAVPLTSRIHEGLVFSNRDSKTLLDKLVALLLSITLIWSEPVILVPMPTMPVARSPRRCCTTGIIWSHVPRPMRWRICPRPAHQPR